MKTNRLIVWVTLMVLAVAQSGCGDKGLKAGTDKAEQIAIEGAQATPKREAVAADKLQNRAGVIYVVNGQEPFSGTAQDFYSSGQMKWEIEIEAGKVVVLKRWHENGVLELSCGFTDGTLDVVEIKTYDLLKKNPERLDGEFAAYFDGGQKFAIATFKSGKPVDESREWTPEGTEIKTMVVETIGAQMIRVAPGTFTMGSPASEEDRNADETPHAVTLSKEYWLGRTEVTQAQWEQVFRENGSRFGGSKQLPVENVSWDDAMAFCKKVTDAERQAGRLPEGYEYTLPTEAQWEYACRAGSTGAYAGDLDAMAWYGANSEPETHPVGLKQKNAWGFYDMLGNVEEWCMDWDGDYSHGSVVDPAGAPQGSDRVYRGGGWFNDASYCRSADRSRGNPGLRYFNLGFRLCLAPVRQ